MTKNDEAWQRFFDSTGCLDTILQQGYTYTTASDLKKIGKREPRLMAKQDTLSTRPSVFRKNHLAIFPVKNGEYIIFHDPDENSYFDFGKSLDDLSVEEYQTKVDLTIFDAFADLKFSESQAIDYAFIASLIGSFTGQINLQLTIRGRHRSGAFHFKLPGIDHCTNIEGVQIEIDSGYENQDAVILIEAKVGKRDNFHIRQLYYPYLDWKNITTKQIIPIFLTYTNGKFYFTQFSFDQDFGKLRILNNKCFTINESPIAEINFPELLKVTEPGREPNDIPYPQADDLDKVIDLISLAAKGVDTKRRIASKFEFDERQGDYYGNAARYLGLLSKRGGRFILTNRGREFLAVKNRINRIESIFRYLLEKPTFREVFVLFAERDFKSSSVSRSEIAYLIEKYTNLSATTPNRRSSTVLSWLKWVEANCVFDNTL